LHDLPAKPRSAPHALRGTAGQEEPATESCDPADTPWALLRGPADVGTVAPTREAIAVM